jgi:Xaa-Pro dipeptidase
MLLNIDRASRLMGESGLDGLLATTASNVFYLSGLWSIGLVLLPTETQVYAIVSREQPSRPVLVVSTGELDTVMDCFPGVRVISYGNFYREVAEGVELSPLEVRLKELVVGGQPESDALKALAAALEESGLTDRAIGLDEHGINPAYPSELKKRFPRLKIKPAASVFRQIRMVKTEEEIKRLRAAVEVTEKAILKAVSTAREGVTEAEMGKEFEKALIEQGGQPLITCLHIGRSTVFINRRPGDTALRKGDQVLFDVGCRYQGYASDIARTFAFGDVGEGTRRYYAAILEGQERGLETIKAGVRAQDVFRATVAAVREAGIPHFRRHHVGHGIGIDVYDPPLLAPGDETVLEEGMVMDIEQPYYEIGTGALAVEDTFVVTKGRAELLTSISRELEVLD